MLTADWPRAVVACGSAWHDIAVTSRVTVAGIGASAMAAILDHFSLVASVYTGSLAVITAKKRLRPLF